MDKMENNVGKISEGISFVPVEIIRQILVRLPAKSAMRCRIVCKLWRDLTSAHDFVDLHLRNSIPALLVERLRSYQLELSALENWWERGGKGTITHTFLCFSGFFPNASDVLFSHAGLIAFQDNYQYRCSEVKFVIMNPARPISESVRISFPEELRKSKIFGVYFHPVLKEYCSLWKIDAGQPKQIQYGVLNLGANPFLKLVVYPFSNRVDKDLANPIFNNNANPLFIRNCLYWMLKCEQEEGSKYNGRNDIMEFDIVSEEFKVIPCPVPLNIECMHYHTHLLDIDGILSFLLLFPSKITIWRLEDHAEQLWTTTEYYMELGICTVSLEAIRGIVVMGENLALLSEGKLLVCDLVEGSVMNRPRKKYGGAVFVLPHQMSLASLKNCKPTISIDKGGEVVV